MVKKKQDPLRHFKRSLWEGTKKFKLTARLDAYLSKALEVRVERDQRAGEYSFLAKQIVRLLNRLGRNTYVASDGSSEVSITPNIRLNNKEEAEVYRRHVRRILGPEAAAVALVENITYSINPEIDAALEASGQKLAVAKRMKKTRTNIGPVTKRTRKGE